MANLEFRGKITSLKDLGKEIDNNLMNALKELAINTTTGAKMDCPVNFGILRNSIYFDAIEQDGYEGYKMGSDLEYAPYVEFGTGTKVSIPTGYEDFAIQFKGQKSVIGMNAHPYLLPNFEEQVELFKTTITKIINNA